MESFHSSGRLLMESSLTLQAILMVMLSDMLMATLNLEISLFTTSELTIKSLLLVELAETTMSL